jgi:hypothetical protein
MEPIYAHLLLKRGIAEKPTLPISLFLRRMRRRLVLRNALGVNLLGRSTWLTQSM